MNATHTAPASATRTWLTAGIGRPSLLNRALPWLLLVLAFGTWSFSSKMPAEIASYHEDVVYLGGQHIVLVAWAGGLAILTGIPAGAILARPAFRKASELILQVFNLGATIPTLAILALCMTILGIGIAPSIFGLWAATLLPIVRNTFTGLRSVRAPLIEAARGMGMTASQIFWRVEFPNAMFVIFGGVRTALAICVGTAPLAFLIGAGGLGELIFTGIALNDLPMMLAGAIPTALLAVLTDFLVGRLQFHIVPRGINPLR
ncbi:osmoprotectant transport system permease protein [Rhizobiales bacterium GAS191]|jgi:osmoprotectant transport system permease protein|nr:osmoprotectant transport system permease protein [Rhizobiales bacterium GAS113]SEE79841.1 osmoprotectant transport system permease protein [Rhizobiales bacterium GAS191]